VQATQDEMETLRGEVEELRAEVALLRSQQAAHVCYVPPPQFYPQPLPGAAGGALPLTYQWPNSMCASPVTIIGRFDTGCAAGVPQTYIFSAD
jgi:hypothetical protein